MCTLCYEQVTLTIRGLESAAAPITAGNMSLMDPSGTGSAGVNLGFGSYGSWTGSGSGAELRLEAAGDFLQDRTYNFSWVVTNPPWTDGSTEATAKYQMSTSNLGLGTAHSTTNTFVLAEDTFIKVDAIAEPIHMGRSQTGVGFTAADAHPLFIRKPALLVANITQSTANPCAINTISVSLRSNVPLITSYASGCSPEIVISGLLTTGTFEQYRTISNVQANSVSATEIVYKNASWTQAEGKLVLVFENQTRESMVFEAGPLYTLDFEVTNPAKPQSSPPINAKMWNGVEQPMDRGSGDHQPLTITDAIITLSNVTQSSHIPCDDTVITITVSFNVPLLLSCSPTLTLRGLTNSRTSPTSVENSQGVFGNTVGSNLTWILGTGELRLQALADVAAGLHVFTLGLRNPDYGQQERSVDINGAMFNLAHSQDPHTFTSSINPLFEEDSTCTDTPATTWVDWEGNGCAAYTANLSWCDTAVNRATANATVVKTSAPPHFDAGKSALDMCCTCMRAHARVYAPLYVKEVILTSRIGQKSPFPCDNNTISVTLSANVALLSRCVPTLKIMNLQNAIHAPGNVSILASSASQFASTGVWNVEGAGNHNLAIIISSNTVATTAYAFSFVVRNPSKHQASPAVSIELSGIFIKKSGTAKIKVDQAMDKDVSNVNDYNPCYLNFNCVGTWAREGTAAPLYVRNAAFEAGQAGVHHRPENTTNSNDFNHTQTTFVSQSSFMPCELNEITVEFKINVPLLTRCNPCITIEGFAKTFSEDQMLQISGPNSTVFAASGTWTRANGKLIVQIAQNTQPNTPYRFSFQINNTNAAQEPQKVYLTGSLTDELTASNDPAQPLLGSVQLASDTSAGDNNQPMYIMNTVWTKYEINQSNPLPCAVNTITVLLATSVKLLQLCTPTLVLADIKGFATADTDEMQVSDCTNPRLLPINGTKSEWRQTAGTLTLPFAMDTVALQEYCLRFTLKNKAHEDQANTITATLQGTDHVSGIRLTENHAATNTIGSNFSYLKDTSPIWSSLQCGLTRFNHNKTANISNVTDYYNNSETYWDERHRYTIGRVIDSKWLIKDIGQSHPYPCWRTNTITVTLKPNVLMQVGSVLTVAGIENTLTPDSTNLTLGGPAANIFAALGAWEKSTGTLTLTVTQHMLPCSVNIFSFVVSNPTDVSSDCGTTFDGVVSPTIQADTICIDSVVLDLDTTTRLDLDGKLLDVLYNRPMKLLKPEWKTIEIGQSTP